MSDRLKLFNMVQIFSIMKSLSLAFDFFLDLRIWIEGVLVCHNIKDFIHILIVKFTNKFLTSITKMISTSCHIMALSKFS